MSRIEDFRRHRERMNERILQTGNLETKRFFALDTRAYEDGQLSEREKELCGLVGSLVLRCDDCITYHVLRCLEIGLEREQLVEAMNVGMVVGGSITIPHIRRAHEVIDEALGDVAASD